MSRSLVIFQAEHNTEKGTRSLSSLPNLKVPHWVKAHPLSMPVQIGIAFLLPGFTLKELSFVRLLGEFSEFEDANLIPMSLVDRLSTKK